MTLKLKIYKCYCATEIFEINDFHVSAYHFGELIDIEPDTAPPYGCGNKVFKPYKATKQVLETYKITKREYYKIVNKLKKRIIIWTV